MTLQSDEQGRITCPKLFRPNTVFEAERQPDGAIRLAEVPVNEPKLVKPIRTKEGFLMLPVPISSQEASAAIRADRDTQ